MPPIRKRRKRIYYSSGIISLLLFPLLSLHFLHQNGAFKELHVMEINWVNEETVKIFSYDYKTLRHYTDVTLTHNQASNLRKLALMQEKIHIWVISKDTVEGIHVNFAKKMPYEMLVEVFNICAQERVSCVPDETGAWIFNYIRKSRIASSDTDVVPCGTGLMQAKEQARKEQEARTKARLLAQTHYMHEALLSMSYLPALLFLGMILGTFWFRQK